MADTDTVGFTDVTGGSRVTFATGMAVIEACRKVKAELCARAAQAVGRRRSTRSSGWTAHGSAPSTASQPPLGARRHRQGLGPHRRADLGAQRRSTPAASGSAFATQLCDVEVDPETGKVKVLRYTAVQDAGRRSTRATSKARCRAASSQGIGWALNEEYIYNDDGRDAERRLPRLPHADGLDLPMIDTIIVEVPNPGHPYGVRGVGEVPIVPPLAAVANAIYRATGHRLR